MVLALGDLPCPSLVIIKTRKSTQTFAAQIFHLTRASRSVSKLSCSVPQGWHARSAHTLGDGTADVCDKKKEITRFSRTLRVIDLRAKNRGRPHPKVCFPAAPAMGRNFLNPKTFRREGQECLRKIRTEKSMFMLLFFPE